MNELQLQALDKLWKRAGSPPQKEMAKAVDCSVATISAFLTGRSGSMRSTALQRLIDYLGGSWFDFSTLGEPDGPQEVAIDSLPRRIPWQTPVYLHLAGCRNHVDTYHALWEIG